MKILFINDFKTPDYLNDMIYHGFITSGYEVYETAYPNYMLSSYNETKKLYGKGFTLYGRLDHTPNIDDYEEIVYKLSKRYYDIIVFGSIHRDQSYLNLVKKFYTKQYVHFIDGEDSSENFVSGLGNYGIYWKREINKNSDFRPISFAIPKSCLLSQYVEKQKLFGHIIPGDDTTYIFSNEKDYYMDYAISYYGKTCMKAGWDCLRHYEILANRCVPLFYNLENCPEKTLSVFPKKLLLEINKYAEKNIIHPNYREINDQLFEYTKNNLTTDKNIIKIINTFR